MHIQYIVSKIISFHVQKKGTYLVKSSVEKVKNSRLQGLNYYFSFLKVKCWTFLNTFNTAFYNFLSGTIVNRASTFNKATLLLYMYFKDKFLLYYVFLINVEQGRVQTFFSGGVQLFFVPLKYAFLM